MFTSLSKESGSGDGDDATLVGADRGGVHVYGTEVVDDDVELLIDDG